tara:strand:- start:620 stop:1249 length:630 start_codon:yes stop_codon:yes gene_type:complete
MTITLGFTNQINTSAKINDLAYYTNTLLEGGYNTSDLDDLVLIGPITQVNRRPLLETSLTKLFPGQTITTSYLGKVFDFNGYPWEDSNDIPLDTQEFIVTVDGVLLPELDATGDENYTYNTSTKKLTLTVGTDKDVAARLLYTILVDDTNFTSPLFSVLNDESFIMFKKDEKINSTGLKGYYTEVKFENNSTEKAELFAVSSEVSQSSK